MTDTTMETITDRDMTEIIVLLKNSSTIDTIKLSLFKGNNSSYFVFQILILIPQGWIDCANSSFIRLHFYPFTIFSLYISEMSLHYKIKFRRFSESEFGSE